MNRLRKIAAVAADSVTNISPTLRVNSSWRMLPAFAADASVGHDGKHSETTKPTMIRRVTRTLRSWTWQKWGLLGLLSVALIQIALALEFWREQTVVANLSRRRIKVQQWPVLCNTPVWRFSSVRYLCRSLAVPYSATFLYELDVSADAIQELRSLPWLDSVTFGKRWTVGAGDQPPLPAGRLVCDEDLISVGRLARLKSLVFNYSNITNDGLEHLIPLRSLKELDLKRANISDAGLISVGRLQSLTHLNLQQTKVTGHGLIHLRSPRNLTALSLQSTPLDVGTLNILATLSNLQCLDLDLTPITDDSIADLAQLTSPRSLTVMGLSEDGMKRLRQALPNCDVIQGPAQLLEFRR